MGIEDKRIKLKARGVPRSLQRMLYQAFVPLTSGFGNVDLAPFMTKAFGQGATLGTFVNAMFQAALAIGAILAVLQIARAGFYYMGSDIWAKKEQGKQILRDAVLGLLLLLAIWLILNTINPQILNLDALKKITPIQSQFGTQPANDPGGLSE